jgi:hypothetical protein
MLARAGVDPFGWTPSQSHQSLRAPDRSCVVAKGLPTVERGCNWPGGGRTWWAHFEFTPINIELIIFPKKIEDLREARASMSIAAGHCHLASI